MADEKYKSVSTFALPDEYQRQASEARRRRRMAEMLAQQAYQPGDIQNAPIPRGAPLVQGLQAYLAARAGRKADEAEESAKETASREARDFLNTLTRPKEDFNKTIDLQEAFQLGTPELVDGQLQYPDMTASSLKMIPQAGPRVQLGRKPEDDQVYMPTAEGRETDPQRMAALLANPQFKSGFTDKQLLEQRRNFALKGMLTSENPRVQQVGGAVYKTLTEKPQEEFYAPVVDSAGNFVQFSKEGGSARPSQIAAQLKEDAKSELGRMIFERKNLLPNDPYIKIYDEKIKNLINTSGLSQNEIANLNLGLANLGLKATELGQSLGAGQTAPVVPRTIQDLTNNYGGQRQFGGDVRAGRTYLVGEQGPELVKFNQRGTVIPNPNTKAPQPRSVIERTSPKERLQLEQKQPTDKKSVLNALGQVSMMKNLVRDLKNHEGVDYIFGPVMSRLPNVRGSATSAQSIFDTLLEKTSTETMKQNRQEGFAPGSISVQEWPRFESALGPLKSTKDPVAMRRALENADAQLQSIEQRIKDNYEQTYGQEYPLDYSAPSYKFESDLYPSPQIKQQKQDVYNRADAILQKMQKPR